MNSSLMKLVIVGSALFAGYWFLSPLLIATISGPGSLDVVINSQMTPIKKGELVSEGTGALVLPGRWVALYYHEGLYQQSGGGLISTNTKWVVAPAESHEAMAGLVGYKEGAVVRRKQNEVVRIYRVCASGSEGANCKSLPPDDLSAHYLSGCRSFNEPECLSKIQKLQDSNAGAGGRIAYYFGEYCLVQSQAECMTLLNALAGVSKSRLHEVLLNYKNTFFLSLPFLSLGVRELQKTAVFSPSRDIAIWAMKGLLEHIDATNVDLLVRAINSGSAIKEDALRALQSGLTSKDMQTQHEYTRALRGIRQPLPRELASFFASQKSKRDHKKVVEQSLKLELLSEIERKFLAGNITGEELKAMDTRLLSKFNHDGYSPLMLYVIGGNDDTRFYDLPKNEPALSLQNSRGESLLHIMVEYERPVDAMSFVRHHDKLRFNERNKAGQTAVEFARSLGKHEMADMIERGLGGR